MYKKVIIIIIIPNNKQYIELKFTIHYEPYLYLYNPSYIQMTSILIKSREQNKAQFEILD